MLFLVVKKFDGLFIPFFWGKNLYIYMLQFSLKAYKWKYQFPSASLVAKSDVRRWSMWCFKKQVTISVKPGLFEFD